MSGTSVVVVGGGPSGLLTAINASRFCDVQLFEEHQTFGQPTHCGGLVSLDAFEKLGVSSCKGVILNKIRGFVLHSPSDIKLEIDAGRPCAQVIDRALFDQNLSEMAKDKGCKLLHRRVKNLRQYGGDVIVDTDQGQVIAQIAIDAEGLGRRLATAAGFNTMIKYAIPASQITFRCREVDPSLAHVFLGELYRGFMAYTIPIDKHTARVGCATRRADPAKICEKICKKTYGEGSKIYSSRWAVWTMGQLKETRIGRILLVGDAAGHTKPTTGGGIVFGGLMARFVGEAAGKFASTLEEEKLMELIKKSNSLTRRMRQMLLLRRILSASSDRTLDEGMQLMRSKIDELQKLLRRTDFDFHEDVLLKLFPFVVMTKIPLMVFKDVMTRTFN
ncbi:MAG: FAD-dependent monooxygenase [Thermoproteota archaeon]